MLLPSSVLLGFGPLVVIIQLLCLLTLSGRTVVAQATGSTVAILISPLFTSSLVTYAQKNSGPFIKYKWCQWSSWSRCSPEPCIAGIQIVPLDLPHYRTDDPLVDSAKRKRGALIDEERPVVPEDAANYCVVKPDSSNRNVYPLLVQTIVDGVIKRREPAKQRVRRCHCRSLSLWQLIGMRRDDECLLNSVQVECGQCGLNENVYQTRQFEFDDSILPFCDLSNTGSVQLYKIIGGVAGAIILVISIVWCARMLVRTVCRSSSSSAVSGGGRGSGGRRNDRDRGSQNSSARGRDARSCRSRSGANDSSDPLQITAPMFNDSELPPAYKDVVSGLPGVVFVGPGSFVEIDRGEGVATSAGRSGHRLCKPLGGRFRGHGGRRDQTNRDSSASNSDNAYNILDPSPDQVASSSQGISPKRTDTPPPPSYEDVMALPVVLSSGVARNSVVDAAGTSITTVSSSVATDGQPRIEEISNFDAPVDNQMNDPTEAIAHTCREAESVPPITNPNFAPVPHTTSSPPPPPTATTTTISDNLPQSIVQYIPHSIIETAISSPAQRPG